MKNQADLKNTIQKELVCVLLLQDHLNYQQKSSISSLPPSSLPLSFLSPSLLYVSEIFASFLL